MALLPELTAEAQRLVAAVGVVPGVENLTDDSIVAFVLPDDEMEAGLQEGDSVRPGLLPDADVTAAGNEVRIVVDPANLPDNVVGETGLVNFRLLIQDPASPRYSFSEFTARVVEGPDGLTTWADPLQAGAYEAIDGIAATTGEVLDAALDPILKELQQTVAALNPVGILTVLEPLPVDLEIPGTNSAGVICAATGCAPSVGATEADQIWVAPPTDATEDPSAIAPPIKNVAYSDEAANDDGTGFVEEPTRTYYARGDCPQGGLGDVYGPTKDWAATIGTAYPLTASDTAWMTFNTGSTAEFVATLGGAYQDYGMDIGWKRSSGRTMEKGSGYDWAPKNYSRSFRISTTYQKVSHYYGRCGGDPYSANWRAKYLNNGGVGEHAGIARPDFINCKKVYADVTWWRNTKDGTNYKNSGGVKAVGTIGIDLSMSRAYTAEAKLAYKINSSESNPKRICGNNQQGYPVGAAGKIMMKSYP